MLFHSILQFYFPIRLSNLNFSSKKLKSLTALGRNMLVFLLLFIVMINCSSSQKCCYERSKLPLNSYRGCLEKRDTALLSAIAKAESLSLSNDYDRKNYLSSAGACDYYDDPSQNATLAFFRAIQSNLDERALKTQTDLWAYVSNIPILIGESKARYDIYVKPFDKNLAKADTNSIKYEVVLFNTKIIPTSASRNAVVCQIFGRFAYRSDAINYERYMAATINKREKNFPEMLHEVYSLIGSIEQNDFNRAVQKLLASTSNTSKVQLSEIVFGDVLKIFCPKCPTETIPGIYLGEGFYTVELRSGSTFVLKFGQEKLVGLYIDVSDVRRSTEVFSRYKYALPTKILECLALQSQKSLEPILQKPPTR